MSLHRLRSKYGAVKTVVDGIAFDSKAEARRYRELWALWRAGEISGDLELQPEYEVRINGVAICRYGENTRRLSSPLWSFSRNCSLILCSASSRLSC